MVINKTDHRLMVRALCLQEAQKEFTLKQLAGPEKSNVSTIRARLCKWRKQGIIVKRQPGKKGPHIYSLTKDGRKLAHGKAVEGHIVRAENISIKDLYLGATYG